jgi:hypothetical protein
MLSLINNTESLDMHLAYAALNPAQDINQINAWKLVLFQFNMALPPTTGLSPIDNALIFAQSHDMNQLSTTPEFNTAANEYFGDYYAELNGVPAPDIGPCIDLAWGSQNGRTA